MIVLLRHGRTEANARGLLLGRSDVALDDLGRRQAHALATYLRSTIGQVQKVVSSPLRRCYATAEIVATELDLAVTVDERWIELDYGELDGLSMSAVPQATWATWRSDITWVPPGGESLVAVGDRVRAACEELAASPDVVVVSHVTPIKAAVAWALGVSDAVGWRLFVAPASVTRIAIRDGRPTLDSFNEVGHLH